MNGVTCSTFKQACLLRHLIQDDREWIHCFREAQLFSSGNSLRNLFIIALTFGQVTDAEALRDEFKVFICDDLQHRLTELFSDNNTYVEDNVDMFYQGSAVLVSIFLTKI